MTDAFEWFDPYEQKARADREHQRANYAREEGRQSVQRSIAAATRDHLSEKMENAVEGLAERIVREAMFEPGARLAQRDIVERFGPEIAGMFRRACLRIAAELELPEVARMKVTVQPHLLSGEEAMTMEFETLKPVRVGYQIPL